MITFFFLQRYVLVYVYGLLQWLSDKESACQCRRHRRRRFIPGSGRSLEESIATHSSILDRRIPWTDEPGGLQSMGSQRVGQD